MAAGPEGVTTLRFIGVDSCVPAPGAETACVLLNERVLVDAGWNAALQMRRFGCEPLELTHLFITHCHHDHYLGLAPLLFYRAIRTMRGGGGEPLVVVGPHIEIAQVVERALAYLQADRYQELGVAVEIVRLKPGEELQTPRFGVKSAQVVHPTLAAAYRFEDRQTGATVVISGDTAYYAPLAEFAAGADVLVHEASMGAHCADPLGPWGHSGAPDAARIAREAQVGRLYLVHCSEPAREEALSAAREVFPETYLPREGELFELPPTTR